MAAALARGCAGFPVLRGERIIFMRHFANHCLLVRWQSRSRGSGQPHRTLRTQPVTWLGIALAFLLTAAPQASAQTPTLVQHYYSGTNSPSRGLQAKTYSFRLPNKTLAGNCLILFLDYTHGVSVSSITDDG